jgi:hypothetical protein
MDIEFTGQLLSSFDIDLGDCDLELVSIAIEMRGDELTRFWPATWRQSYVLWKSAMTMPPALKMY